VLAGQCPSWSCHKPTSPSLAPRLSTSRSPSPTDAVRRTPGSVAARQPYAKDRRRGNHGGIAPRRGDRPSRARSQTTDNRDSRSANPSLAAPPFRQRRRPCNAPPRTSRRTRKRGGGPPNPEGPGSGFELTRGRATRPYDGDGESRIQTDAAREPRRRCRARGSPAVRRAKPRRRSSAGVRRPTPDNGADFRYWLVQRLRLSRRPDTSTVRPRTASKRGARRHSDVPSGDR